MAFQLRGHGLGDMDCSKTPNDPVCVAYYGTTPTPPIQSYSTTKAILQSALLNKQLIQPGAVSPFNAGANVIAVPGSAPIAVTGATSWWAGLSWFWKLAILGGGAFLGWKGYQKFVKKA